MIWLPLTGSAPSSKSPLGFASSSSASLHGQLVGGQVLGHVGTLVALGVLLAPLDVRAVAADAELDVVADGEGGDLPGVDRAEVGDQGLQAAEVVAVAVARVGGRADPGGVVTGLGAEVEALEPRHGLGLAPRDAVEVVLHAGGEVVVDEPAEVLLQQVDHGEGQEGRDERRALLEYVTAIQDGPDDRGVRGGAADLALFEAP